MARTFIVNTIEDPTTLVTRARQAASNGGAQFRGNETSGSFSGGGIRGIYRIQAGTVEYRPRAEGRGGQGLFPEGRERRVRRVLGAGGQLKQDATVGLAPSPTPRVLVRVLVHYAKKLCSRLHNKGR